MSNQFGRLLVVATPIGNLGDLSERAREALRDADLVAAEDTRRTGRLLSTFGIDTELISVHEHNEAQRVPVLIERLLAGETIALVSDAGTPLVSDPGYRLVAAAAGQGIDISPIPGASALLAALSIAGLPSDRFCFEGFLPSKRPPRRKRLNELAAEDRTLIFYVSVHRFADVLADLAEVFGGTRRAVLARELTKLHESIYRGALETLAEQARSGAIPGKGEFVLVVEGSDAPDHTGIDTDAVLAALLEELPPAQAARLAAKLTGTRKRELYELAKKLRPRSRQS